jgi:AbiV family abortive infection protein
MDRRQRCIDHAADLLRAATSTLRTEHLPHVAYHLATVALEELGKAALIGMGQAGRRDGEEDGCARKRLEDHVGKLFIALWGPTFGAEVITKNQVESFQGLARRIHETRLQGLYVDADSNAAPGEVISRAEAEEFLRLVEGRLEFAKSRHRMGEPLTPAAQQELDWFLEATRDLDKRALIFGSLSMQKLAEFGRVDQWIRWIRDEMARADALSRQETERELSRPEPTGDAADAPKWRIKVRLFSGSHSIRAKPLQWWNDHSPFLRLYPVGNRKRELIVEVILKSRVHIEGVWNVGLGITRRLLTALNFGTMGFFWWYLPEQISGYYEEITDLESKGGGHVLVELMPRRAIDWGREALSEGALRRAAVCYGTLPGPRDDEGNRAIDHYLRGLTLLAKTDIHLGFEANAFQEFFAAIKWGSRTYADWDGASEYDQVFLDIAGAISPEMDRVRYLELAKMLDDPPAGYQGLITLSEVGTLKVLCDAYHVQRLGRLFEQRAAQRRTPSQPESD